MTASRGLMRRVRCPHCGREVSLHSDGTLHWHLRGWDAAGRQLVCAASNTPYGYLEV